MLIHFVLLFVVQGVLIEYFIENHILEEMLRKNRSEILGSLLEEFDKMKYERTIREESFYDGMERGIQHGLEQRNTE